MRKQYHFWRNDEGLDAWDVNRLIELTKNMPVTTVRLDELTEIDSNYWELDATTTVRAVAEHLALVRDADTSYPIILARNGRIMDGMHRVVQVLLNGGETIEAVRFEVNPPPDFKNCSPKDLAY